MATKSNGPENNTPAQNTYGLSRMLTVVSFIAAIVGVVLVIFNLKPFNDNNAGLMIGIGCMVGAIFIYFIGKSLGSMQARSDEGKRGIKDK